MRDEEYLCLWWSGTVPRKRLESTEDNSQPALCKKAPGEEDPRGAGSGCECGGAIAIIFNMRLVLE